MENTKLRINMLGGFSIQMGNKSIDNKESRSRKVWLLLAYLICCRKRFVTQEELSELLWRQDNRSTNPLNALKTIFHRARTLLDQLKPGVGHTLLLHRNGGYAWNEKYPISFDVDTFMDACRLADSTKDSGVQMNACLKAAAIYKGDFLPQLNQEPWILTLSTDLHELYLRTILHTLPLMEEQNRFDDATALCQQAVTVEPRCETLYQYWMRNLLHRGRYQEAETVYLDMRQLLFDSYGIMPSAKTQALYREAVQTRNDGILSLDRIQEQMAETPCVKGALLCDYDFFRILYQATARGITRDGGTAHICLLSIRNRDQRNLSRRSLDLCMKNLCDLIRASVRWGDAVSRCSVSQYILLLPHSNYENSINVCLRIIRAFCRQYPHSPAVLDYSVQPISTTEGGNDSAQTNNSQDITLRERVMS